MNARALSLARAAALLLCAAGTAHASRLAWTGLDPDARSAALGGCGIVLESDVESISHNPAMLGYLPRPVVSLTHGNWFGDSSFDHAAFGAPLAHGLAGALRADYADLGSVESYRVSGDGYIYPDGSNHPTAFALGGGLGKALGIFALGASARAVWDRGFGADQNGLLWSMGAAYHTPTDPFSIGFSVGGASGQAADNRSVEFCPGVGLTLGRKDASSLLALLEGVLGGENPSSSLRLGLEYAFTQRYFARLGYRSYNDNAQLGGTRGWTAGLGWRSNVFELDYAFTGVGVLGNGQQFSLRCFLPPSSAPPQAEKKKKAPAPQRASKPKASPEPTPGPAAADEAKPKVAPDDSAAGDYHEGMKALKEKRYSDAQKSLRRFVEGEEASKSPDDEAEACAALGDIYQYHRLSQGHLEEARKYYLRALKNNPRLESATKGLADLDKN